jgi:hypothetical protein
MIIPRKLFTKLLIAIQLFVVLFLNSYKLNAQVYPDAGLWTTTNLEWGINSRYTFILTEEIRLKENFTQLNLLYTNVGIEYKIFKFLKTSISYRSIQKAMLDQTFSYRHRIQWDINAKKKLGSFELSYRHRLQSEVRDLNSSDDGYLPEWYSRSKFQLKYNVSKVFGPYFAIELRYQIKDPRKPESDNLWHRVRYQSGVDYKVNSHNYVGLYYLIQKEFNIKEPQDLYIVGLEYTFKF